VIAHVGGVPLETLLPSVSGAGAGLLLAWAWLRSHLRRGHELNDRPEEIVDNPDGSRRPTGPRLSGWKAHNTPSVRCRRSRARAEADHN